MLKRVRFSSMLIGWGVLHACSLYAQSGALSKAFELQPREEFLLEIPKIFVSIDNETREFNGVRITFPPDFEDQIFIGTYDDMYIKTTSDGREKVVYRELPGKAGCFSKFEVKYLIRTDKYFISSLEVLEKLLHKNKWGRCLYFDAYFPRFLCGYYSLICAARNSESALPIGARIPEKAFDVSMNSPKTDARINRWRSSQDTIIKLRIASLELAKVLKSWVKSLKKVKHNMDAAVPKELEDALVVFVRVYFGLKPSSTVVVKRARF